MLLFMYLSKKKIIIIIISELAGVGKILIHVSLPRSPNYSGIWKPQSYLIQPLENPACGRLVCGYQTHHESRALGCPVLLLRVSQPATYSLQDMKQRKPTLLLGCAHITGFTLVLTSSPTTNVVFWFSLRMCAQGKSNWRLEVLLPVGTSRNSTGDL